MAGVYQYFDSTGKIIYVGKAKNLRRRVSSYFSKVHDNRKTEILVRKIFDIKHIVVDDEEDALFLENNLIKKYLPRYNVLLKDDKTFPWICIKNESFPRVFFTRKITRDGSVYFGPYTSVYMVKAILDVIKRMYPIRSCNFNLSCENISKNKFHVCLEYQIGNCMGPCEAYQTRIEYDELISQVKDILKGNLSNVSIHLKDKMKGLAEAYKFEEAANVKSKIEFLENYKSKSTIVSSSISDVDVFSFDEDDNCAYVNFIRVVNGAIIQAHTLELVKRLDESKQDLLVLGIVEIRQKFCLKFKEIIIPFPVNINLRDVKIIVPKIGDKRKLLDLSQKNVNLYKLEKNRQLSLKSPQLRIDRLLEQIMKDLRLTVLPRRIECFDNSNIQGAQPVASCVVFIDGKPAKKEYRHFNIKTIEGPNDYGSIEEIVFRRYDRVIKENGEIPQLIIIDGGKGQLSSAIISLKKLNLFGNVAVIGIAKKLEEIFYHDDPIPLYLDKNSETLRVIQFIRNEAHRFGILFHRNKRSKEFITNELSQVSGIGEKTIEILLRKFKSVSRLKAASKEEIINTIGVSKAKKIYEFLK